MRLEPVSALPLPRGTTQSRLRQLHEAFSSPVLRASPALLGSAVVPKSQEYFGGVILTSRFQSLENSIRSSFHHQVSLVPLQNGARFSDDPPPPCDDLLPFSRRRRRVQPPSLGPTGAFPTSAPPSNGGRHLGLDLRRSWRCGRCVPRRPARYAAFPAGRCSWFIGRI